MRICGVHHVGRSFAIPDALGWEGIPGTDRWAVARVTFMDASTEELRAAHDVLSEFYAERLADALDRMPEERALLGLFCELVLGAGIGANVGDIGCGTGRLDPFLAAHGLSPTGVDLSPEMIRVARRDQPGFEYHVADLRELPFPDASLAGIVCWYSLMYLAPSDRPAAFAELARVVKPGGYLLTAFKAGDGSLRRGGLPTSLGVEFDIYWLSPDEMERRVNNAGFATVFWGGIPPEKEGASTQGYLIARKA
jgi:SAM-dependent methyltransferase